MRPLRHHGAADLLQGKFPAAIGRFDDKLSPGQHRLVLFRQAGRQLVEHDAGDGDKVLLVEAVEADDLVHAVDKLRPQELLQRLQREDIKEVIIATNSTVEGEATALWISKYVKQAGIKVTRIASGVPVGGALEFIDEMTLFRALEGRTEL